MRSKDVNEYAGLQDDTSGLLQDDVRRLFTLQVQVLSVANQVNVNAQVAFSFISKL